MVFCENRKSPGNELTPKRSAKSRAAPGPDEFEFPIVSARPEVTRSIAGIPKRQTDKIDFFRSIFFQSLSSVSKNVAQCKKCSKMEHPLTMTERHVSAHTLRPDSAVQRGRVRPRAS